MPQYEGDYVQNDRLAVGFLYRPDRVRVSDVKPLFMDDAYAFPRAPLSAFVEVVDEFGAVRFDFVFIVVHLKAQGDARSQYRRIAAIEALDEHIRAATGERDFVVVGDYNDRLTDERGNNVFLPMLDDPVTYTFLTLRLEQSGEKSYIPIPGFIDHILITNEALPEYGLGKTESIAIEAVRPSYESVVSDHRPIRALFEVPDL
jgi:endonuclease/exonuclease/phosphatase family metal-dependent hydrolase